MREQEEAIRNRNWDALDDVLACLEDLGDHAMTVPQELREKHSDLPWTALWQTSHSIKLEHYRIDPEHLMDLASHQAPKLRSQLQVLLATLPPPPE